MAQQRRWFWCLLGCMLLAIATVHAEETPQPGGLDNQWKNAWQRVRDTTMETVLPGAKQMASDGVGALKDNISLQPLLATFHESVMPKLRTMVQSLSTIQEAVVFLQSVAAELLWMLWVLKVVGVICFCLLMGAALLFAAKHFRQQLAGFKSAAGRRQTRKASDAFA